MIRLNRSFSSNNEAATVIFGKNELNTIDLNSNVLSPEHVTVIETWPKRERYEKEACFDLID